MSLFADTYTTIEAPSKAEVRERGSRFFAFAFPIENENQVKEQLKKLREEYPDATHHCYAYKLGLDNNHYRVNDDGEPSNSAGRPILRAILSAGVTNVLVVVVRYFAGKLLGVPGLIQSYGEAATLALKNATVLEKELCSHYRMEYPFELENEAYRFLRQEQATITAHHYTGEQNVIEFSLRLGRVERVLNAVKSYHQFKIHYLYTI